jgi:exonuclease III
MKIAVWNCRGLGNRSTVRGLLGFQKSEGADILFLSETKLDERRMQRFRWMLGLTNMLVHDCGGQGGGIAVLWRRGVDVSLRTMSKYHIDMDIKGTNGGSWRFTGLYGEPHHDHKYKTWITMRNLISYPAVP